MEKFISDIANFYWWLSVVIVGLIINIISSYLKQKMDTFLNRYSTKRKEKRDIQLQDEIEEINKISKSDFLLLMKNFEEFRFRHRSLMVLINASFFFVFAIIFGTVLKKPNQGFSLELLMAIFSLLMGAIYALLSIRYLKTASKHNKILFSALDEKLNNEESK